jgi:hypothetical protein
MRDYAQFVKASSSAQGAGERPSVRAYIAVKLVDNMGAALLIFVLVVLMLLLTYLGLFGISDPDGRKWAQNSASMCLGAFLGLFAGKRLK